jgi:hypothetical protein
MTISLQQTDTTTTQCSPSNDPTGLNQVSSPLMTEATQGGTAGSSVHSITVGPNNLHGIQAAVYWQSNTNEPNLTSWQSGNWTVRFNITGSNSNLTWDSVYIYRMSSNCGTANLVASATGMGISMGSVQVLSKTLSGSSQSASASDTIYVILAIKNSQNTNQSFSYHSDQLIDTPLSAALPFVFPPPKRKKRPPREARYLHRSTQAKRRFVFALFPDALRRRPRRRVIRRTVKTPPFARKKYPFGPFPDALRRWRKKAQKARLRKAPPSPGRRRPVNPAPVKPTLTVFEALSPYKTPTSQPATCLLEERLTATAIAAERMSGTAATQECLKATALTTEAAPGTLSVQEA